LTSDVITLVLSICAILFSATTAILSFMAWSTVVGLKNSTHQIQWMPIPDEEKGPEGEDLVKEMGEHMYPDLDGDRQWNPKDSKQPSKPIT
jgi:hypothetical protein